MRADDLMAAVFPDQAACPENLTGEVRIPDHPLVQARPSPTACTKPWTWTACGACWRDIQRRARSRTMAIDTPEPSPFSHEILNANPYAYPGRRAARGAPRARGADARARCRADYAEGAGALDAEAIAQVAAEAWPPMRDADELHEALFGLVVLPVADARSGDHRLKPVPPEDHRLKPAPPEISDLHKPVAQALACESSLAVQFACLVADRRAATMKAGEREFWIAAERVELIRRVYPGASIDPELQPPDGMRAAPESAEACAAEILRGWFECSGPRAHRIGREAGDAARSGGPGAGAARSRRPDSARPFHPRYGGDRSGATAACWRAFTA